MWSRLLALTLIIIPLPAMAGLKEKIASLAPSGIVLVVDKDGNELIAQNVDKPFAPASVTKIVTAWLAMQVLGGDYRFETKFYLDKNRVLYVKGGGDPFLISEELETLGQELVAAIGKEPVTGMVLDASYFPADIRIPGIEASQESYDALNSALAVNFNTIAAVRKGATVRSAEPQTPITPLAASQFKARGPKSGSGRISLAQDPALSLQYAGELIAAFIEKAGGDVKGKITAGSVPAGLQPVYVHKSRPLSKILVGLLIASNNYIANQVFLEVGGTLGGSVSLEKSLKVLDKMLAENGLTKDIHMEEGSGISRDNRFTARGLAKVLSLFAPHAELLHGHDGGLNKTGTMSGISTLAGYADTQNHGRVLFVIALKTNGPLRFQLLKLIEAGL